MKNLYISEQKKQLLGHIRFHEQLTINEKNHGSTNPGQNKILIIHTGGTIGMFLNQNDKYSPKKQAFKHFLLSYPYFCDEEETYFNSEDGFSITPPSIQKKKIWYKFLEVENLIDSTDMNIETLNSILQLIEKSYDKYDAFIILHGTDTMSFTASALSFMIENLKKTIILTGAQIPIGSTRNDSANNLLSSLVIAGHYCIPQVLIIFDNTILRGNRSTKASTSSFSAFKTPNLQPLGKLGLTVQIQWEHVFPSNMDKPTQFRKMTEEVEVLKLTPFGFSTIPSKKYVVVQSYGIGNVPTQGAFYNWIYKNSQLPEKQRTVMVNISQVYQSIIKNDYATGHTAFSLGLIPGSDMTCEAAVAKLSFLATVGYKNLQELSNLMTKNLRGQLTEEENRQMKNRENFTVNCLTMLEKNFSPKSQQFKDILIKIIHPQLILENPSKASVNRLLQYDFDIHYVYPDNSNILHLLMKNSHIYDEAKNEFFLSYLIEEGIDLKLIDKKGNSAVFYGVQAGNYEGVEKILQKGGILKTSTKRIFQAIKKEDLVLLNALVKFQDPFEYKNEEGRNCAFYALIQKKQSVCNFLSNFTNLFTGQNRKVVDIYGFSLEFYMQKYEYSPESESMSKKETENQ